MAPLNVLLQRIAGQVITTRAEKDVPYYFWEKKENHKLKAAQEPSIGWGESSPKKMCIGT